MDVYIEKQDGCRRTMRASAGPDEVQQEADTVLREYSKVSVPGFRKGKVPSSVIHKRFHREISDAIGKHSARRLFDEALNERTIERAGPAYFSAIEFDREKGLNFVVEFDITPDIAVPDFRTFSPSAAATNDSERKNELSDYLLDNTTFQLPQFLVEQEATLAVEQGQQPNDKALRIDAERRVKLLLILSAIAKTDGIEVDDRDINDRIDQMAETGEISSQALRTQLEQQNGLERLALFLLAEQTLDYILSTSPHP